MLKDELVGKFNEQINLEFFSSNLYLQMSAWCDNNGLNGASAFLLNHADEEMMHMKRLFQYVKETGSLPMLGSIEAPAHEYESLSQMFELILQHEKLVTSKINELAHLSFSSMDYSSFNFLQWYIAEQHEEENLFSDILDKIQLLGDDGKGLYLLDKELMEMSKEQVIESLPA